MFQQTLISELQSNLGYVGQFVSRQVQDSKFFIFRLEFKIVNYSVLIYLYRVTKNTRQIEFLQHEKFTIDRFTKSVCDFFCSFAR